MWPVAEDTEIHSASITQISARTNTSETPEEIQSINCLIIITYASLYSGICQKLTVILVLNNKLLAHWPLLLRELNGDYGIDT